MNKKDLKELAMYAAKGTAPEGFSKDEVNDAFTAALQESCGSINKFNKNKYDLFEIIVQNADVIVPRKTIGMLGAFAEVRTVGQGQKAVFKSGQSLGRQRAKKFLTQVGLAGVYETFRLDSDSYEVKMGAIGGGVSIDFERMLDGNDSLAELMDIISEGMAERALLEVQRALRSAVKVAEVPAANRVISNGFDADKMFALVSTVKAYSGLVGRAGGAVIFAPPEFIAAMGPDAIVPAIDGAAQGIYHEDDIDAIHKTGFIKIFRGTPVVELPQSFVDETNKGVMIDPQLAYVLPSGKEKVVKIVYEGETQMYDHINRDQSIEIMVYKKMGVGIESYHNWGIYQNTKISGDSFVEL